MKRKLWKPRSSNFSLLFVLSLCFAGTAGTLSAPCWGSSSHPLKWIHHAKHSTLVIQHPTQHPPHTFQLQRPSRWIIDLQGGHRPLPFQNHRFAQGPFKQLRVQSFAHMHPPLSRLIFTLRKDVHCTYQKRPRQGRLRCDRPLSPNHIRALSRKRFAFHKLPPTQRTKRTLFKHRTQHATTSDAQRYPFSVNGILRKTRIFSLKKPPRLVVDLYGVRVRSYKTKRFPCKQHMASRIRLGRYRQKTRLVLDLCSKNKVHASVRQAQRQLTLLIQPQKTLAHKHKTKTSIRRQRKEKTFAKRLSQTFPKRFPPRNITARIRRSAQPIRVQRKTAARRHLNNIGFLLRSHKTTFLMRFQGGLPQTKLRKLEKRLILELQRGTSANNLPSSLDQIKDFNDAIEHMKLTRTRRGL
ncbi:MAG: AMIN domain-containing protein, partial [Myxococcota bacterium]